MSNDWLGDMAAKRKFEQEKAAADSRAANEERERYDLEVGRFWSSVVEALVSTVDAYNRAMGGRLTHQVSVNRLDINTPSNLGERPSSMDITLNKQARAMVCNEPWANPSVPRHFQIQFVDGQLHLTDGGRPILPSEIGRVVLENFLSKLK
jgi:hypothetical protein